MRVSREFNEAQQNQKRMRGVLQDARESLDIAFMHMQDSMSIFKDRRDLHDAAYRGVEDAGKRITETKRKADDAHDQIRARRDRCRRVTAEFVTAEEDLNDCLGRMEQLALDTARATHALSCGDSNEVRYLQETLWI